MQFTAAPVLETKRLRLRPCKDSDFEQFAAFYASPRSKYADGPVSRSTAWSWFAAAVGRWSLVGYGAWAIERRSDNTYIGMVSLNHPIKLNVEHELGWFLWEAFEGHGYALEAAIEAKRFASRELGWNTFVSYISINNDQSVRLAERMGASLDDSATHLADPDTLVYRHNIVPS